MGCATAQKSVRVARLADIGASTEGALIQGSGSVFWLAPPEGWVMDGRAGADEGMPAVFYPAGASFADAPAVMFVRGTGGGNSVPVLIERDKERVRRSSKVLVVAETESVATPGGRPITIMIYSSGAAGCVEAVAYVDETTGVIQIGLRAASQNAFDSALPAFEALLNSYRKRK